MLTGRDPPFRPRADSRVFGVGGESVSVSVVLVCLFGAGGEGHERELKQVLHNGGVHCLRPIPAQARVHGLGHGGSEGLRSCALPPCKAESRGSTISRQRMPSTHMKTRQDGSALVQFGFQGALRCTRGRTWGWQVVWAVVRAAVGEVGVPLMQALARVEQQYERRLATTMAAAQSAAATSADCSVRLGWPACKPALWNRCGHLMNAVTA